MPKASRHLLIGKTFNYWKILALSERPSYVVAQCLICRTQYDRKASTITSGISRQCRSCAISKSHSTHGLSGSRTAAAWYKMRQRAEFVDRWSDLETFIADVGEKPEGKVLYRPDPSKPWGPGNAEWVPRAEMCRRTRMAQPPRQIRATGQLGWLQVKILRFLSRYRLALQGPMRVSVIAHEIGRNTSTVCDCLAKLRRRGLVRKRGQGWELDPEGVREAMAA